MIFIITWFKVGSFVSTYCFLGSSSVSDRDNEDEGLTRAGEVTMIGEIWWCGECGSLTFNIKKWLKKVSCLCKWINIWNQ